MMETFFVQSLEETKPWSETCVMVSKGKDLDLDKHVHFHVYFFTSVDILNLTK
jgi:hypothetical protein